MKWTYRFFYWSGWLAPLALMCFGAVMQPVNFGLLCVGFALSWFPFAIGHFFARAFTTVLCHAIQCPGCQLVYPAKAIWRCGCGFQPHYEQHILNAKCKLCTKYIGHVTCDHCGTTIFVR